MLDLPLLDRMYKEMTPPSKKLTELRGKIADADAILLLPLNIITVFLLR
jgi:hypothetical protein